MPTIEKAHWCSTSPDYTLSKDGKFWVYKDGQTKFCNVTAEEHRKTEWFRSRGHSIESGCTKCSDYTC